MLKQREVLASNDIKYLHRKIYGILYANNS